MQRTEIKTKRELFFFLRFSIGDFSPDHSNHRAAAAARHPIISEHYKEVVVQT